MISAVIVYFDETEQIEACLESVKDFAQIVIIDIGSSNYISEIAKKYQAHIYKHEFVRYVEKVRDFAISKAAGDWILVLDPDEQINSNLKVKLNEVVAEKKFAAVNIPRKNIFFGRFIAHTNWWPDKHVRFFKKGLVKWNKTIHQYPIVSGKVLDLEAREDFAILHYGYRSVKEFMDRQNRYSTIEAENLYNSGVKFSWFSFFWKPGREFLVRFIRHAGFLDGFYGFTLTILMMIYQMEVMVKLWELERQK